MPGYQKGSIGLHAGQRLSAFFPACTVIGRFGLAQLVLEEKAGDLVNPTIVSQRLVPRHDRPGRVAVLEILRSPLQTREYVQNGEGDGKTLLDAMRVGKEDEMQHFDGELDRLVRAGIVSVDSAMSYATNPSNLRLETADFIEEQREAERAIQQLAGAQT